MTDISRPALEIAARNVRNHALGDRVKLLQSDIYNSLEPCKYDLIVSNPPYVPRAVVEGLPGEYQAEPDLGLISGSDGLDIPLRIIRDAPEFLNRDGILVCEVGESDGRLQDAMPGVAFTWLEFETGGATTTRIEVAATGVSAFLGSGRGMVNEAGVGLTDGMLGAVIDQPVGGEAAFALVASPWWGVGLLMAVGTTAGAQVGAGFAQRFGARMIKPLLVVTSTAMALRLLF